MDTFRRNAIIALLEFNAPLSELSAQIAKLPWDCDESVELRLSHLRRTLERFLAGDVSAADVERWADLIECRDDVDVPLEIRDLVFQLANPLINPSLTPARARELLASLPA